MANDIRINMNLSNEQILDMRAALQHIPGGFEKAAVIALNKTVTGIRTDAKKQITQKYDIKSNLVLAAMGIKRATNTDLKASLITKGAALSLTSFKYKASSRLSTNRKPVFFDSINDFRLVKQRMWNIMATVLKGSSHRYQNAFMAKFGSKLMIAKNENDRAVPLWGPSIPVMLEQPRVMPEVQRLANVRLAQELTRAMDAVIAGYVR